MSQTPMKKIYLYTRFERFWHWAQAVLILFLLFTGLEVHGVYAIFGYEEAVELHNLAAWTWLILYIFIIFWEATTGEWKQYIPTTRKLVTVAMYYSIGIFRGDPHPVPKTERVKHNPLQRLTYLGIALVLVPLQIVTGILYYFYNDWAVLGIHMKLGTLAAVHMFGALMLLAFVIVHVYMTTTGHTIMAHIKAMISGWEEVPDTPEEKEA
ncbi:Thiosulfate reductase cytochrome b subunit [Desulfatibacillum alkenivorans DSM 16219]|uniref:Thiosulfate reductase cytochrome b subunit n=1 Tax=Desulfatibacillum alkenivorans DSM 16219 TaxID=1121393 RepID=A0A1M6H9T2_9BACT|nr:cytochrome b/b6 domain-containing protein [Desulfatibacillum alkenivorans]SHJ18883.1 Thiosulfate reductase cytochrome b subunit [Desulfatibacillum alkenivorans DSM 16219]